MTNLQQYTPGPASGAQIRKDGEKWTLILVRELRHAPEKVWQTLTDPVHLMPSTGAACHAPAAKLDARVGAVREKTFLEDSVAN